MRRILQDYIKMVKEQKHRGTFVFVDYWNRLTTDEKDFMLKYMNGEQTTKEPNDNGQY